MKYSIKTSAAEYVYDISRLTGQVLTTANVREAYRMSKDEAAAQLRHIKAGLDNGAEMFENPE